MSEILHIDDDSIDNEHPVALAAESVENAMSEFWVSVDLRGPLLARSPDEGRAVTPNLSAPVNELIRSGIFPFTLSDMLERQNPGTDTGSSNVTAIHVLLENTVEETVKLLANTGQLDDATEIFESQRTASDPSAEWLTTYCVFTYSKGWVAEQIITNHPRFSKGGVTNDQAGQDVRDETTQRYKQVKPVSTYARKSPDVFKNKETDHVFYQWKADGGLTLGDTDAANAVNKAAIPDDMSATLAKSCHKQRYAHPDDGAGYRYLWW